MAWRRPCDDGRERFSRYPSSAATFGKEYEAGDTFVQPDLARTLDRIARDPNDFYEGETARLLAAAMAANGGLITSGRFEGYKAVERQPLTGSYKGYEVITAPPPSSGGVGILQMLGVLEGSGYEKGGLGIGRHDPLSRGSDAALLRGSQRVPRRPRFHEGSGPCAVESGLHQEAARIHRSGAREQQRDDSPGTFKAMRARKRRTFPSWTRTGNAVSLTYTLNGGYGSGVTAPGLGFLLNNEMDDFAAQPGSPNMFGLDSGRSERDPAREAAAFFDDADHPDAATAKLFMVVGGPGGGRIINSVLQTILNVIDFGMNVAGCGDAPRFHHQWLPDKITMERGFSPDTVALLEQRGHTVEMTPAVARVFAIVVRDGWLQGARRRPKLRQGRRTQ